MLKDIIDEIRANFEYDGWFVVQEDPDTIFISKGMVYKQGFRIRVTEEDTPSWIKEGKT